MHAAAYSNRPGTIAERKLVDDVPQDEKKLRLKAIEILQERIATEINAPLLGRKFDVLVEGRKRGKWFGRNRNDKLVFINDEVSESDLAGKMVNVKIEKTAPWSLQGTITR